VNHFDAVERNPSRAGHHVHAIWCQSGGTRRKAAWKEWHDMFEDQGGQKARARIEPVRHFQNVVDYCAKYIMKDDDWWNVKLKDPRLLACSQQGIKPEFEQPILQAVG
jgi:hypothetical protein